MESAFDRGFKDYNWFAAYRFAGGLEVRGRAGCAQRVHLRVLVVRGCTRARSYGRCLCVRMFVPAACV